MKKIGVITINDLFNYGNRLQNYAVQYVIKKYGVNVENIIDKSYYESSVNFIRRLKVITKNFLNDKQTKRYINFIKFNKNIKYSRYVCDNNNNLKRIEWRFYSFIVGSDQVWNPYFAVSNITLLKDISSEKRISFSASIGVNSIPKNKRKMYIDNITKFKKISVRENSAKAIIEELTGRDDIEVLVDPTMLLTADEWDIVMKRPKKLPRKKYILNYFLGKLSDDRKKEIDRVAKDNNCSIINILDKNDPFYVSGPSEFLYLEKNAFLICTDSFHSSVFAILYNRPFIIFDREDKEEKMNDRIDTLLSKFNLKNRKYNGKKITQECLIHDYSEAYNILEKEREKANKFIKKSLDIR